MFYEPLECDLDSVYDRHGAGFRFRLNGTLSIVDLYGVSAPPDGQRHSIVVLQR